MNLRKSLPENVTDEQVADLENEIEGAITNSHRVDSPFKKGKKYLVRTVTMIDVGKVKLITKDFLVLTEASWIADTGRFNECLQKADGFNEVEPFKHDCIINLNAIVDATEWPYTLPKAPK